MAHWQHRPEEKWQRFAFNQPYAKGLERVRKVLAETDFDPATLWQWGTMQAMAIIQVLQDAEAELGEAGQKLVYGALRKVGHDVGRQILAGVKLPDDFTPAEFASFYATVINRIAYASLEDPRIDAEDEVTFDILWCPHQDHYQAFDCRVQRYFVFDSTIPAGAPTCHFTMWKADEAEKSQWATYTSLLERKALEHARRK
jgi:hypothetical protein